MLGPRLLHLLLGLLLLSLVILNGISIILVIVGELWSNTQSSAYLLLVACLVLLRGWLPKIVVLLGIVVILCPWSNSLVIGVTRWGCVELLVRGLGVVLLLHWVETLLLPLVAHLLWWWALIWSSSSLSVLNVLWNSMSTVLVGAFVSMIWVQTARRAQWRHVLSLLPHLLWMGSVLLWTTIVRRTPNEFLCCALKRIARYRDTIRATSIGW